MWKYLSDHGESYGFQIMDALGFASGTLYGSLSRLRDAGEINYRVEQDPPDDRPARTYYWAISWSARDQLICTLMNENAQLSARLGEDLPEATEHEWMSLLCRLRRDARRESSTTRWADMVLRNTIHEEDGPS